MLGEKGMHIEGNFEIEKAEKKNSTLIIRFSGAPAQQGVQDDLIEYLNKAGFRALGISQEAMQEMTYTWDDFGGVTLPNVSRQKAEHLIDNIKKIFLNRADYFEMQIKNEDEKSNNEDVEEEPNENKNLVIIINKLETFRQLKRGGAKPEEIFPVVEDMIAAIVEMRPRSKNSTVAEYQNFLSKIGKDKLVEMALPFLLDEVDDPLFVRLFEASPIVALTTKVIDKDLKSESPEMLQERPVKEWFEASLNMAAECQRDINIFFTEWQDRLSAEDNLPKLFLEAWQEDMDLIVAECMNLACCFALHVQREDCALYLANIPIRLKDEAEKYNEKLRALPNRAHVFSDKYYKYLSDENIVGSGRKSNVVYMPTPVQLRDIIDFLDFFKNFWHEMVQNFQPPFTGNQINKNKGATYAHLNKFAELQLRPFESESAQARVAILPLASRFKGFDLRVDRESKLVSFDAGNIGAVETMNYIEAIVSESQGKKTIPQYTAWVDNRGAISSKRKKDDSFLPSIMRPGNRTDEKLIAERASLFIALISHASQDIGMHSFKSFSYHRRGRLTDEKIIFKNFAEIVRALEKAIVK